MSCFGLSVVCKSLSFKEDAAAFACGKQIILGVNFEKLLVGLKCKEGARRAPPALTGVLLRCEASPARTGRLVDCICGDSIIPFPLWRFAEPVGRCLGGCIVAIENHVYVTFKKKVAGEGLFSGYSILR